MENYESLGTIGEGTYGVVLKCRHKTTGQIVAIKKFKESDDDEQVKKTALREIKILKQLKHENIVSLLEVFRVKGKLYLVFEFVEKTILEEIEKNPEGLDPITIKRLMWQLVRAIHFCHQHNIIHRDIKPENLLVSRNGVLKLCDFGFARPLASAGAKYTEYVSTRWYRAPELLVGDVSYGKAVDVWSIGCMFAEISTGLPLFPGDSDIDQLYHIIKCLGHVTSRQQELFKKNSLYVGVKLPHATELEPLETRFVSMDKNSIDFLRQTIKDEPLDRWTCAELLTHPFFENTGPMFEAELQEAIARDLNDAAALKKKRSRKPSRVAPPAGPASLQSSSNSNLPSPTVGLQLPIDDYDSNAGSRGYGKNGSTNDSGQGGLKPTFKAIPSVPTTMTTVPKDKVNGGTSGFINLANKKSNSSMAPSYHLPTLGGLGGNGNSSNSSVGSIANSSLGDGNGAFAYSKKALGGFGHAINEDEPSSMAMPVPSDHMEFIQQHTAMRVSMTSHGGRQGGGGGGGGGLSSLGNPYSGMNAFGAPPKPPPASQLKSPYMGNSSNTSNKRANAAYAGGNDGKNGRNGANGQASNMTSFVSCSLQSSMEIYSPKKYTTGASGNGNGNGIGNGNGNGNAGRKAAAGARGNAGMGMAMELTPQGIYVPPRTSQSTTRSTAAHAGTNGKNHTLRRENDVRSF